MRYFREMGIDAYLLLYSTDGIGVNAHFTPENDTWNIEKWSPFIIQTPIPNGSIKGIIKVFLNYLKYKSYLKGYDYIIGNGFAPALCYIFKLNLDLFLPYGYGIEFTPSMKNNQGFFKNTAKNIGYYLQKKGLVKSVKRIGTIDMSKGNLLTLMKFGITDKISKVSIPMVFVEGENELRASKHILQIIKDIKGASPKVFSHVSHVKYELGQKIKRNDILITGFADYIKKSRNNSAILILVDYGDNVVASKKLITDLHIDNNVIWLPKLTRKELMYILKYIDLGGGELGGAYWGGTGWEFLASGVPFFQNIGMSNDQFEENTGTPMPDIFNVVNSYDICKVLFQIQEGEIDLKFKSKKIIKWFNTYNGKAEASKILSLITG